MKPASESSTSTQLAPTTGTTPTGQGKQLSSNDPARTGMYDKLIRAEAIRLLRQHGRMAVDEIYNILNVRYMEIRRDDVNAVLIVMGFEGALVIDYEPVAYLK